MFPVKHLFLELLNGNVVWILKSVMRLNVFESGVSLQPIVKKSLRPLTNDHIVLLSNHEISSFGIYESLDLFSFEIHLLSSFLLSHLSKLPLLFQLLLRHGETNDSLIIEIVP